MKLSTLHEDTSVKLNILILDRIEGTIWAKQYNEFCVDNQGNWFDFIVPKDKVEEILNSAKQLDTYSKHTIKDT